MTQILGSPDLFKDLTAGGREQLRLNIKRLIDLYGQPRSKEEWVDKGYEEVRVTDPETGAEKGSKIEQLGAIDPVSLHELGKVAGVGAEKYDTFNYLKGYSWSLSYHAIFRHMNAFWAGEDLDPDDGLPHIVHAAWHGLALASFMRLHPNKDDRPYTMLAEGNNNS
jgi:hypothetical protein